MRFCNRRLEVIGLQTPPACTSSTAYTALGSWQVNGNRSVHAGQG